MILGLHVEVLLSLVYSLFLISVAFLLELMARKSHRRAEGYKHAGFVYFSELDYFECPAGHRLVQIEMDHQRRSSSYRAPAGACNSCSLKLNCTDSDEGRRVERRLDTWITSEIRKFHRGISLTLLLLATALLSVEYIRNSQPHDRNALALLLVPLAFAGLKFWPSLWRRREMH
jgi:hypothetical protein